jgi:hypothetical protein
MAMGAEVQKMQVQELHTLLVEVEATAREAITVVKGVEPQGQAERLAVANLWTK